MSNTAELRVLAIRHDIDPEAAETLPAIFDNIAKVIDKPVRTVIIDATYMNDEFGAYVADIARKAIERRARRAS